MASKGDRARRLLGWMRAESARWESERALRERFPQAHIDDGVTIVNPDRLELGEGTIIQTGTVLHCGGMSWSGGQGSIRIGKHAVIAQNCVLYGAGVLEIGDYFNCGPGCLIFSSQERISLDDGAPDGATHLLGKTTFEDESRVGAGAIVGHGLTIGRGAIVGGNSLLMHNVPPMELWAGNPARKLKDLDSETWRSPRLNQ
jgi:acetyltransferase-like isoleucine patch superfamily enzyme